MLWSNGSCHIKLRAILSSNQIERSFLTKEKPVYLVTFETLVLNEK